MNKNWDWKCIVQVRDTDYSMCSKTISELDFQNNMLICTLQWSLGLSFMLDNTKVLNSRSISCCFGPLKWAYKAFAIVVEAFGGSYVLLSVSVCKSFSNSRGYSASFQEEKVISYAQAKDGSYFFPFTHCTELFLFLSGEQETGSWLISGWAANANTTERKKKKSK